MLSADEWARRRQSVTAHARADSMPECVRDSLPSEAVPDRIDVWFAARLSDGLSSEGGRCVTTHDKCPHC